jgi:hypothetical protein
VRDILDQLLAQVFKDHAAPMTQVIVHSPGDADLAALDQPVEPSGNVHAVSENVVVLDHDIADIDTDAKAHPPPFGLAFICLLKRRLDLDCTPNCVEHAGKFGEHAIAGGVRDPASILSNELVDDGPAGRQRVHRRLFVTVHQAAVALDIGGKDCRKPSFEWRCLHLNSPTLP